MTNDPMQSKGDTTLVETERAQASASDPGASVWVSANAGTGKTHVLTLRVLRLLLSGTQPQRILCLTYTKAAAAEMSKRVFDELAKWVTETDAALAAKLSKITGTNADAKAVARARTLFTCAIETPGGLKVQTIHSFAERLLQRFPLEAGVPPGFRILDDVRGREIKASAIEAVLLAATADLESSLGRALTTAIRYVAEASFDELLSRAVAQRTWLDAASRFDLGKMPDDFAAAEKYLRHVFDVRSAVEAADIQRERASVLSQSTLEDLRALLAGGTKSDITNSAILAAAHRAQNTEKRAGELSNWFIAGQGKDEKPRSRLITSKLATQRPDLDALAGAAQQRFFALSQELKALELVEATTALYRLAGLVLQKYRDAKMLAGSLDFDDLIERTRYLLSTASSAHWVQYKLDGGLDHILVDEAQDTSPEQWQIIEALGREFFSGHGAREAKRTIFAVGDEKQSIYSFQGARPEQFEDMAKTFATLANDARVEWRRIPLNLSFRTVAPVLHSVDCVFRDTSRTPGLTAAGDAIRHAAKRQGQAGCIEIWPTEKASRTTAASPWRPQDDRSERSPIVRLAERIAETIGGWLSRKDILHSGNRPIEAGDILILVRKRQPFTGPLTAALKARDIAIAGADRMALIEQLAVQDLLAIGDFVTLPEDDLSLACILKGPLFNFDDDDLLAIAASRKGSLWKAFLAKARSHSKYKDAAELLRKWRSKADFLPPFEFFSSLLDRDFGRTRLLHRLGPEAPEAIDEFLDFALTYDDGAPPSLTGFLAHLRSAAPDVKRDMEHGRNEVRVMTVHGAKGLEAPIVILPDTCTTGSGDSGSARLLNLGSVKRRTGTPEPVIWPVKGTSRLDVVASALQAKEQRETEERNRLLYVAMTRARDRLYVTGFENSRGRDAGCWYDLICEGLGIDADSVDFKGAEISCPQTATVFDSEPVALAKLSNVELPGFAKQRAPSEPQLTVPLAPSRLEPYAPDAEGEPILPPVSTEAVAGDVPSPLRLAGENRFLRGTLTHALLEHLPSIDEWQREQVASTYVATRGAKLSGKIQQSIVTEALAILKHVHFAPIFSQDSRAEVPISATLPRPRGKGPALKLSGQIDRLAVSDGEVLIVDYKTNRPPPADVATVAPAYLYQMAAYSLALAEIYPGRDVRAALLWTDGPRLMELPANLLTEYQNRLWDLKIASLDGD